MSISKRLRHVAEMVTDGYRVADIGTDHGYVPLLLLKEERVPYAIAVDISKGSLEKARENAVRFGLEKRMECRLADGLQGLKPNEADSIIICGMGGILMRRILDEGLEIAVTAKELILSPHRNPELILEFMETNGFSVVIDEVFEDKKKKYRIFKGVR